MSYAIFWMRLRYRDHKCRAPARTLARAAAARAMRARAAVGDLVRLCRPDLGPQVVFLGLPIPPLTDKEKPDQVADIKTQGGT